MNSKKTMIFRVKSWRFFVIVFPLTALTCIVIGHFFFGRELKDIVAPLIGLAIGLLLVIGTYLPKFNIILSDNWIEGLVSGGTFKRIRASYKDINLAKSKLPTAWTAGYLKLYDGRKLNLNFMFLSPAQGRRLMEEVKKRSLK